MLPPRLPDEPARLAAEQLSGFPAETVSAYLEFAASGDGSALDAAVLGIPQHFLPTRPPQPLKAMPLTTRLAADLGCDSLSLISLAFLTEELFAIQLQDEELAKVATLGGLLAQFREHFRGALVAA